jgi:hypothetical protein
MNILKKIDNRFTSDSPVIKILDKRYPVCENGLTVIYGESGVGKSFQVSKMVNDIAIKKDTLVIYFDGEVGNGDLAKHIKNLKKVEYVNCSGIDSESVIRGAIALSMNIKGMIFVFDSFRSIFQFDNINNSEAFTNKMNNFLSTLYTNNQSVVIIDHSTKIRTNSGKSYTKIEGNETGKFAISNFVCEYVPEDKRYVENGGRLIIKKSRKTDLFRINDVIYISNNPIDENIKKYILTKLERKGLTLSDIKNMSFTDKYNIFVKHSKDYKKDDIYRVLESLEKYN